MYWEVEEVGVVDQLVTPRSHRLSTPACYSVFIYRAALIGYDKLLVDTYNTHIALAFGAGSHRVVEAE